MARTPGKWRRRSEPYQNGIPYQVIHAGEGQYDDDTQAGFRITAIMSDEDGAAIAAVPALLADGEFLLERLSELEITDNEFAREWFGHVEPAIERFRAAISKAKATA